MGEKLDLGSITVDIVSEFLGGWQKGKAFGDIDVLVKKIESEDELIWLELDFPEILPLAIYSDNDYLVLKYEELTDLSFPLDFNKSFNFTKYFFELLDYLSKSGLTFLYLDPSWFGLDEEHNIKLKIIPPIIKIGKRVNEIYYENTIYPPDRVNHGKILLRDSTYLGGAVFYYFLTGKLPNKEGVDYDVLITEFKVPGLLQFFYNTLTLEQRRWPLQTSFKYFLTLNKDNKSPIFKIGSFSTVGLNPARETDEDSCGYKLIFKQTHSKDEAILVAALADGMGGMEKGELASKVAIESFINSSLLNLSTIEDQVNSTLEMAWEANEAVIKALGKKEGGCTFSGVVIKDNIMTLAHAGDTRVYFLRDDELKVLTKDHSYVATLLELGMITEEQAKDHPQKSKILRALGLSKRTDNYIDDLSKVLDNPYLELKNGDVLILVCDGVWGEISEEEFKEIALRYREEPAAMAKAFIDAAISHGAPDNATALVIRYEESIKRY